MSNLEAALQYQKKGYSIIPVKQNKRPFIKWEKYQSKKADENQIRQWWQKWPNANIAIVTGKISGIDVIDADSKDGEEAIEEFCSDSMIIPRSRTPKGGSHSFFRHREGLSNGVRVLTDTDLRTDGGYVLVPPSSNGNGKNYEWEKGISIFEISIPQMPDMLYDILKQSTNYSNQSYIGTNLENIIDSIPFRQNNDNASVYDSQRNNAQQNVTKCNIDFSKGSRDNSIFHVANCLTKGGMQKEDIEKVLEILALNCTPPFSKSECKLKIDSALKRNEVRNRNWQNEILELLGVTSCNENVTNRHKMQQSVTNLNVSMTTCYNLLQAVTKNEKAAIRMAFSRLCEQGLIEKTQRIGEYRVVDNSAMPENWMEADENPARLWLPFDLSDFAIIPEGGIILIAGEPNAGKTAVLMNIGRYNMQKWEVNYLSTETSAGAFKRRAQKFDDLPLSKWKINFFDQPNLVDTVKGGSNKLWIIDYVELYNNFWEIGQVLADIHKKLNGGILAAAIQKHPGSDTGIGGVFTQFKPSLSIALKPGIAKITKLKEWNEQWGNEFGNPNKKEYHFKLVQGWKIIKEKWWHYPIAERR